MFAGLVATASSRSSSHGRDNSSSPTVSAAEEGEGEVPDTYGDHNNAYVQAFFSSPVHTHASSPRTDGRRLASEEFQSPYSMATYPSPSTGNRRSRHVAAAQSGDSPAALRSWGTASMYDDDRDGGEIGGAAMYRLEDEEEEEEMEETPPPPPPASAAATHSVQASPPKTSLEALADERTSSSSASSYSAEDAALGLPLDDPPRHAAPSTGKTVNTPVAAQRLAVPSRPLVASTLSLSPVKQQRVPAAVSADSLSPVTPPLAAAPLSPLTPTNASDIDSNTSRDGERRSEGRRSGTREGREVRYEGAATAADAYEYASSSSSSSPVSHRSATPCAPPPDSPPDSAMKRPPGAVVAIKQPPSPTAQTDEAVDRVFSAAAAPADSLAFEVAYVEEGHRVQLQTQETEERRCLFRAHRAVLTVYRMWAAEKEEDAARGRGDTVLRVGWDGGAAAPPVVEAVVHRIADRGEAAAWFSDGVAPEGVERSNSAASSAAADRVQSFLSASIESARERRSGSAKATISEAAAVAPPHTLTPTIAYRGDVHWEERRALPYAVPHTPPPLSTSVAAAAASATSPAASRVLDYSSLLMADTRGPADTSLTSAGGRWAQRDSQRRPPPPSSASSSRLFSPWRWDRSDQRSPPQSRRATAAAAARDAAGVWPSFAPYGTGGAVPRLSDTPLIPHIRRTSPLTSHTAAAAAAATAGGGGSGDTTWREEGTRRAGKSAAARRSPASLLSDTYLSVRGYGDRGEKEGRSGFSPFAYSRSGHPSPALVRSPHVAAKEGVSDARSRRGTPPWNRSPNLRSTAAACRDPSLLHEEATGVPFGPSATTTSSPPPTLGFVPNNAFYQRQRASAFTTPSSVPLEAEALYARGLSATSPAAPSEASRSERRRRQERLSSYVQYKRFFDTEYGVNDASESLLHTQRAAVSASSRTFAQQENVWRGVNTTSAADRQTPLQAPSNAATTLRYAARDTNNVASVPTTTSDDSVRRISRRWSPDALPRRAVPHPTTLYHLPSKSTVGKATQLPTPSLAAVESYSSGAYADVGAARLARLCTLEQLCRAEVQRRWMEDQNTLLHRFVMEGTAALQRGRVRPVLAGASTGTALTGQLRHHAAAQKGVVEGACAWTFIPNEMD